MGLGMRATNTLASSYAADPDLTARAVGASPAAEWITSSKWIWTALQPSLSGRRRPTAGAGRWTDKALSLPSVLCRAVDDGRGTGQGGR